MSPLELMQRLAALVPRPRLHLIRFHGVLAPHAKLRAQIIPSVPLNANQACDHHAQTPPASTPSAHKLWLPTQTGIRSPYQLELAPGNRPVLFASPTPFIRCAGKSSTCSCSGSSGVRIASSIATREDTEHRYLRAGRVSHPRIRMSQ